MAALAVETPAEEAQAVAAPGAVTEAAANLAMAQARGEVREAAARALVLLGAVRATQGQEVRVRIVQARETPVRETPVLAEPGTIIQEPKILELEGQGLAIQALVPPAAAKVTMAGVKEGMEEAKVITAVVVAMIAEAAEAAMVAGKVTTAAVVAMTVAAAVIMVEDAATMMAGAAIPKVAMEDRGLAANIF